MGLAIVFAQKARLKTLTVFAKLLVAEVLAQVEELETQLRMSAYAQAISLTLMRLLSSVRV